MPRCAYLSTEPDCQSCFFSKQDYTKGLHKNTTTTDFHKNLDGVSRRVSAQNRPQYLLDNPAVCRGRTVLDLGSGCGASAIAAKLSGAAHVVANDIDAVAAVATRMNSELNCLEPPVCLTNNMIGSPVEAFDLILLGDMFYDEALATSLHSWLDRCIKTHGTQVLIGDPGRAQFEEHSIRRLLRLLAQFELPESVREENYGLTCSSVWCYCPEL